MFFLENIWGPELESFVCVYMNVHIYVHIAYMNIIDSQYPIWKFTHKASPLTRPMTPPTRPRLRQGRYDMYIYIEREREIWEHIYICSLGSSN